MGQRAARNTEVGFYVKICFRLGLCEEQSFWILPVAVLQLEPAYIESVQCFLWILNKSLFEKMQMIVLGSADSPTHTGGGASRCYSRKRRACTQRASPLQPRHYVDHHLQGRQHVC